MDVITTENKPRKYSQTVMDWMIRLLVTTVWTSALIFGIYILAFYAIALFNDDFSNWNRVLPSLYDPNNRTATIGIGVHFIAGGIILMLGCIQMISSVRNRYPELHRWSGRVYVLASIIAAVGGTVFIFLQGTIGGTVMDIGFGFYGLFIFIAAIFTVKYAMQKQMEKHRAWGIRLFALAIGSWLYRMDYGFWLMLADGLGHRDDFHGPFDYFMSFFFYVPNLLVAEVIIGKFQLAKKPWIKVLSSIFLLLATVFLAIGTFYFTKHLWKPGIMTLFN